MNMLLESAPPDPEAADSLESATYTMDVQEAAAYLGVSLARLSQITGKGVLSYVKRKVGSRWRTFYNHDEVKEWHDRVTEVLVPRVKGRSGAESSRQNLFLEADSSESTANFPQTTVDPLPTPSLIHSAPMPFRVESRAHQDQRNPMSALQNARQQAGSKQLSDVLQKQNLLETLLEVLAGKFENESQKRISFEKELLRHVTLLRNEWITKPSKFFEKASAEGAASKRTPTLKIKKNVQKRRPRVKAPAVTFMR
jgi:hypothetical protein